MEYQPSQPPADWQIDETREQYGLRVLAACVADPIVVYHCSDDQLGAALHVAPVASAVHVTIAADKTRAIDYRTVAADAIADVKRTILRLQAARLVQAAQSQPVTVLAADQPSGGSKVPRVPIVPSRPPAGQTIDPYVDVRPVF